MYSAKAFNGDSSIHILHNSDLQKFQFHHEWMDYPSGECCTSFNGWTEIDKDFTDNLIWVPNADGGMTMLTQKSWEDFNAWCDAIHIDCHLQDPEI
ncbi:MAG: hypothetical protein KME57_34610 [Scytonema hyalinum WJT4-NPBG1]|jgi:hypothetical protein|nr:hypothetical protein [Scytonema hyalinum WJT4-NPBG1]